MEVEMIQINQKKLKKLINDLLLKVFLKLYILISLKIKYYNIR